MGDTEGRSGTMLVTPLYGMRGTPTWLGRLRHFEYLALEVLAQGPPLALRAAECCVETQSISWLRVIRSVYLDMEPTRSISGRTGWRLSSITKPGDGDLHDRRCLKFCTLASSRRSGIL